MKIIIITTGDEVLQGIIVDTNTAWISERCQMLGHELICHISIGDNLEAIGTALMQAAKLADCVIVTGGLGPTVDDLTIEAFAKIFNIKLNLDEDMLELIKDFFQKTGRQMSESNNKQALIPENGLIIPNNLGTAPGIQINSQNCEFFFLPGVPRELYPMFEKSIMPWLESKTKGYISSKVIRCFGLPEATIDEKIKEVNLGKTRLSFRVKYPEVLLKIIARSDKLDKAEADIEKTYKKLKTKLGDVIYTTGENTMAQVVGNMLTNKKMTVSVAESCTGGLISNMLTDIPGSSEYFERGVISYSNSSKQEILGISEDILRAHGAVSAEIAIAMAESIRIMSKTSIGISVTGIAGPGGGTSEKPVGTVYMAYSTENKIKHFKYLFSGDRERIKLMTAMTAINMLRCYINSI